MMSLKKGSAIPSGADVNQSICTNNLQKIKEFDSHAEISGDEKSEKAPFKLKRIMIESDLEAKIKKIPSEPRFHSNSREPDQDVQPFGKIESHKEGHRNERTEKIFDLEADEEDHKSIDSDNFEDSK